VVPTSIPLSGFERHHGWFVLEKLRNGEPSERREQFQSWFRHVANANIRTRYQSFDVTERGNNSSVHDRVSFMISKLLDFAHT